MFTIESLLVKMADALKLTSSPLWRLSRRRQYTLITAFTPAITIMAGPIGASEPRNLRMQPRWQGLPR